MHNNPIRQLVEIIKGDDALIRAKSALDNNNDDGTNILTAKFWYGYASTLEPPQITPEEINIAQYMLTYIYLQQEDYDQALIHYKALNDFDLNNANLPRKIADYQLRKLFADTHPLPNLPDEKLLSIFSLLNSRQALGRLASVSKRWRAVSEDDELWKAILANELAKVGIPLASDDWHIMTISTIISLTKRYELPFKFICQKARDLWNTKDKFLIPSTSEMKKNLLITYAQNNNPLALALLLEANTDEKDKDPDSISSSFKIALAHGYVYCLKVLLKFHIPEDIKGEALFDVFSRSNLPLIELLLQFGVSFDYKMKAFSLCDTTGGDVRSKIVLRERDSDLQQAVESNDTRRIDILIPFIEMRDTAGKRRLIIASASRGYDRYLIPSVLSNVDSGTKGAALIIASHRGHPNCVQLLICEQVSTNHKVEAFFAATHVNNGDCTKILLEHENGFDTELKKTALREAVTNRHPKAIEALLKSDIDYETQLEVLDETTKSGYIDGLIVFLQADLPREVKNSSVEKVLSTETIPTLEPLIIYSLNDPIMLQLLIQRGIIATVLAEMKNSTNVRSTYNTLVHKTIFNSNPECLRLLLDQGFDINQIEVCRDRTNHYSTGTPLMLATWRENIACVSELTTRGANIELQLPPNTFFNLYGLNELPSENFGGYTALHFSIKNIDCLTLLITAKNFDRDIIDLPNDNGKTALHLAVHAEKRECVGLLLKSGANMHLPDKSGITPFMYASKNAKLIEEFLPYIEQSLKFKTSDQQESRTVRFFSGANSTQFHLIKLALEKGYHECAICLSEQGISPEIKTKIAKLPKADCLRELLIAQKLKQLIPLIETEVQMTTEKSLTDIQPPKVSSPSP